MIHKAVMDTSAICALAFEEPGADKVIARLRGGGCVMHAVNASEICFTLPQKRPGEFDRRFARALLDDFGVEVMPVLFDEAWIAVVAEIRLKARALNIGDGAAVALAGALDMPLVTAEKAFLEAAGFARIELIR